MKVSELIKLLSDFSPNADVEIITFGGASFAIVDYGWDSDDASEGTRDTSIEKLETKSVSLFIKDESEMRQDF